MGANGEEKPIINESVDEHVVSNWRKYTEK